MAVSHLANRVLISDNTLPVQLFFFAFVSLSKLDKRSIKASCLYDAVP